MILQLETKQICLANLILCQCQDSVYYIDRRIFILNAIYEINAVLLTLKNFL